MTFIRTFTNSRALLAIMTVSVALRVVSALYQGDIVTIMPGTYDQLSYHALARRILGGAGLTFPVEWWPVTRPGEPTAHWSFLYTFYLWSVYALVGSHPLVARLVQAVVAGVLQPWLTYRIGSRLFGPRIAAVAAAISACYVYFVYYAGALMTETFYILAILWAFDLATRLAWRSGESFGPSSAGRISALKALAPWAALGLALAIAALLRQVFLIVVPLVLGWVLWSYMRHRRHEPGVSQRAHLKSVALGLLVASIVLCASILPWTLRNYAVFGRFVLLNTNSGYAFFFANHPIYGTDFVPILPWSTYVSLIPPELRGLDEAALDQALLQQGVRFVLQDPARYARLSLSRVKSYFEFWPSEESIPISNVSRVVSFGLILPFTLYGLVRSAYRWRHHSDRQRDLLVLLWLFISAYSLIHLLSWALIRYRLPVDAVLVLFAALGLADLARRSPFARRFARQPGEAIAFSDDSSVS